MSFARCRFCGAALRHTMVDLGMSPLCESYLTADQLDGAEAFYPLHVQVCEECLLVQLQEYVAPEQIFSEYAYFSSYSTSWLEHAEQYVAMATRRLGLGRNSLVVELASNDGYLLQYFVRRGIPALGIEPAANVAEAAREKGVDTLVQFFGREAAASLRDSGRLADLVVGNNVLAQVPDINSFVAGVPLILKPGGTVTMEFPHVLRLMEGNQLDTIYHEHFSYFSLLAVETIFGAHGLTVFDVEELWTHGGSLRVWARHADDGTRPVCGSVVDMRRREEVAGLREMETYGRFEEQVRETKRRLLELLIKLRRAGRHVAGYGAPGKGNTLLNYCGIRQDFVDYTVDRNPYKQGKFLPGTHIPIFAPSRIDVTRPDYVLVLPWNFRDEILRQLSHVRAWGGRFILPIPEPVVLG
jgi:SAM-dependent methyltransferase